MKAEENYMTVKVKNMIKEGYYTINYLEGYIDALFDWDLINDNQFAKVNAILEVSKHK